MGGAIFSKDGVPFGGGTVRDRWIVSMCVIRESGGGESWEQGLKVRTDGDAA